MIIATTIIIAITKMMMMMMMMIMTTMMMIRITIMIAMMIIIIMITITIRKTLTGAIPDVPIIYSLRGELSPTRSSCSKHAMHKLFTCNTQS